MFSKGRARSSAGHGCCIVRKMAGASSVPWGLGFLQSRGSIVLSIPSPKCSWMPHVPAEVYVNLRCTLTVPLTPGRSFSWCPATRGCCRAENFCRGQTTGLPAFLPTFHPHISAVYMFCLKILAFLIFASSLDLGPGESALIFKTFQSFY